MAFDVLSISHGSAVVDPITMTIEKPKQNTSFRSAALARPFGASPRAAVPASKRFASTTRPVSCFFGNLKTKETFSRSRKNNKKSSSPLFLRRRLFFLCPFFLFFFFFFAPHSNPPPPPSYSKKKNFRTVPSFFSQAALSDAVVDSVLQSVDAAPLSSHSTQGGHGVDVLHHASPEGGAVFFMPTLSYMGRGALESSGAKMKALGLSKALVVTDAVLNKVGAVAALTDLLTKIGIGFVVYDGVEPNPTVKQVHEGVEIFKREGCDFVIR